MDSPRPYDLDAERALLGAMMLDSDAADAVLAWPHLVAEDLYRPEHAALYRVIASLRSAGAAADIVAVADAVRQEPGRVGGIAYVVQLPEHTPSTANAMHYARIVADAARSRALYDASQELARGVLERRDPRELAAEVQGRIDAVRIVGNDAVDLGIMEAIRQVDDARDSPAAVVPTGHDGLDALLSGGIRGGDLCVVAGRASWGKSAFCLSMLIHAASEGIPVGMISLEMDITKVVHRTVARLGDVPVHVVASGPLDPLDEEAIGRAHRYARDLPLTLYCPARSVPIDTIASKARQWVTERGVKCLVIDYLEKIDHYRQSKYQSEPKVVGATVQACKSLAVDLGIAVILVCQLNRTTLANPPRNRKDVEWWENIPLPQLHHLKESGSIEQDADTVIFPVPAEPIRMQGIVPNLDAPPGAAVLILAKNRQGPLGQVRARWDGPTASYRRAPPELRAVVGGRPPERHYTEREDE